MWLCFPLVHVRCFCCSIHVHMWIENLVCACGVRVWLFSTRFQHGFALQKISLFARHRIPVLLVFSRRIFSVFNTSSVDLRWVRFLKTFSYKNQNHWCQANHPALELKNWTASIVASWVIIRSRLFFNLHCESEPYYGYTYINICCLIRRIIFNLIKPWLNMANVLWFCKLGIHLNVWHFFIMPNKIKTNNKAARIKLN